MGVKWNKKIYCYYMGYFGGLKEVIVRNLYKIDSIRILWCVVYGMLLKNNFRFIWMKRLYLFESNEYFYVENIFIKLEVLVFFFKRFMEFILEEIVNYFSIY